MNNVWQESPIGGVQITANWPRRKANFTRKFQAPKWLNSLIFKGRRHWSNEWKTKLALHYIPVPTKTCYFEVGTRTQLCHILFRFTTRRAGSIRLTSVTVLRNAPWFDATGNFANKYFLFLQVCISFLSKRVYKFVKIFVKSVSRSSARMFLPEDISSNGCTARKTSFDIRRQEHKQSQR